MRAFRPSSVWSRVAGMAGLGVVLAAGASLAGAGESGPAPGGARAERREALIELGRRLFFDPRASRTGARSCASCHDPEHGFSDPAVYSDDELGLTRRHSQTLLDSAKNPSAHWDGEFTSVEQLVLARVGALQGGHHGFASELTTKSEQRERGRQAREAGAKATPGTSGTPTGGPVPVGPPAGSGTTAAPTSSEEPAASGNAEPQETTDPASSGPAPAGAPKSDEDESKFVPTPKDNPDYQGRFANPTGAVGNGLKRPDEAPADPASSEPVDAAPAAPAEEAPPADAAPAEDAPAEPPKPGAAPPPPTTPKKGGAAEDEARKRREEEQAQADAIARLPRVADVLDAGGRYREAFQAAFGTDTISDARIAEAVAAYVRTIESTASAYDRYVAGEADALTPLARQGMALFRGRAGCAQCHVLEGKDAALTDYSFHNTGIVWRQVPADSDLSQRKLDSLLDAGRQGISTKPVERRAFKTPTLRDVAERAPYMHDGTLTSLTEVVKHYAAGGSSDPRQDARLKAFEVTAQETAALVAFLESLTGGERPGQARTAWSRRALETVLTLVDARGRPLPDVAVRLVPVGDVLPTARSVATELALKTDELGRVIYTPPQGFTHMQVVLPADMGRLPTEWIPDSSRATTVRAPVLGRVRVVVTSSDIRALPETLAVEHPGAIAKPGQPEPRTTLLRIGAVTGDAGLRTALYAGWVREDLPHVGHLRIPGDKLRAPIELTLEAGTTQTLDLR